MPARAKQVLLHPTNGQRALLCGVLGALCFLLCYGPKTLDVTYEAWIWPSVPEADIVQSYAGWMAMRNSPWHMPLTYTDVFLWPEGTLVTYTDSNPLFSVIFKWLSPVLPETFQFFGWFVFFSYVLQGVSAGLLVGLFVQKPWQVYVGVLPFLFAPILIERAFRHTQLTAHFLVLFALYLYFRCRREGWRRIPWQFVLLNALAVWIHPYFLPMVMSVLAVLLVEYVGKTRRWLAAAGALAGSAAVVLVSMFLTGNIGWSGSQLSRGGYGTFSMNLNSLFNPLGVGSYQWSFLLGRHPVLEAQQDSFNYLGLGMLLFLFVCVLHWFSVRAGRGMAGRCLGDLARLIRYRLPLLAMALLLTLFAISNRVAFHNKELFVLPLPEVLMELGGVFRASGRLFYPVYYLIFLFVIRYLAQKFSADKFSFLICVMVCIQLLDLGGVIGEKHQYLNAPPVVTSVKDDPVLMERVPGYTHMLAVEDISFEMHYRYMVLPARYGLKSNIGVVNTGDYTAARRAGSLAQAQLLAGELDKNTIYIVKSPELLERIQSALEDEAVEYYPFEQYVFIFPL